MEPISYNTRGFVSGNFGWQFLKITSLSMAFMFLLIFLSLPSAVVLILYIVFLIGIITRLSGNAQYTLSHEGLTREIRPFWGSSKNTIHKVPWSEVKWYQEGKDLNRSFQEYHLLKIGFHQSREIWRISSNKETSEAYKAFRDRLFKQLEGTITQKDPGTQKATTLFVKAKRRKHFYESIWGKITALFFLCLSMGLLYLVLVMGGNFRHWWRLLVIIIPGTFYMLYRTFIKTD